MIAILIRSSRHSSCRGRAWAQPLPNDKHSDSVDRFYQIESWLPTPNDQRTASGAPGPGVLATTCRLRNRRHAGRSEPADHRNVEDHLSKRVAARAVATSGSNWTRIGFAPIRIRPLAASAPSIALADVVQEALGSLLARMAFDGGYKIDSVTRSGRTSRCATRWSAR